MSNGKVVRTRPSFGVLIVLPLLLSLIAPIANASVAQDEPTGTSPEDIWSDDYINMISLGHRRMSLFFNSRNTTPMRP